MGLPETSLGIIPGYGGTQRLSECDARQLVAFLQANPDKARAWASVEGIDPASIPAYVAQLRQVVLRRDTPRTQHPAHLFQAPRIIDQVAKSECDCNQVERSIGDRSP